MKGLILSGGKGTRLQPLTYTLAKQLVPVANKPVLFRVIDTIREAGVREIGIIIAPHTGEEIKRAVKQANFDAEITFIMQDEPKGLAHAVRTAYEQGFLNDDERFAMFLGDNVIEGGIGALITDFDQHPEWNAQVVLKEVPNASSYGVAVLRPDGSIERLIEKPPVPPTNLALVGIYMFDGRIKDAIYAIQPSKRGEYEITDAIQWLLDNGNRVYPHIHQGWFIDTGKPYDMLEANACVLEELTPAIAADAVIENAQIDKRVTVQAGAVIRNSIIRGPAIIGEGAVIEDSYIGPFTSIYHRTTIRNCEIERCIILEDTNISNLPARLQDSLIGRNVTLTRNGTLPRAMKMNLGDHSVVYVE
ncbi:MAG: glucose-1-phosphate thymidylyltransferase [Anaerolineae bacterium]|jgi:glucose-1-phosphate thymidylyltransferase|nr:glucose-1-phosphate thymidylyltransferase [Anaerolineae bacterium]